MRRRTFIAGLGGAVAWPVAARAQQPGRIHRIGVLASLPLPPLQRFAQKLQQLGYSEDRNLQIEYRFAEGHDDQYPILAEQLVGLPVDLIVTWGTPAALAAKQATAKVPIIMGAVGEAVNTGIVTNLARPGGNILALPPSMSSWTASGSKFSKNFYRTLRSRHTGQREQPFAWSVFNKPSAYGSDPRSNSSSLRHHQRE